MLDKQACKYCRIYAGEKATAECRMSLRESFGTETLSGNGCLPKDKAMLIMLGELIKRVP